MKFILSFICFLSLIVFHSILYSQVVKGNNVEGLKVYRLKHLNFGLLKKEDSLQSKSLLPVKEDSLQSKSSKEGLMVHTSFQYSNFPDNLNVWYYGINLELFFNEKWSISGPLYYGIGSNDVNYIHVPGTGIIIILFVLYYGLASDQSDKPASDDSLEWLLMGIGSLLLENINFHIPLNDKIIISPYVSLFGIDFALKDDSTSPSFLSLGWGGLNAKIHLTDRFAITANVGYRHFFNGKNGYNTGIHAGYLF